MMQNKLAPSMMCCDFLRMGEQLKIFEENDIEILHLDIMDGHFVPNYALGTDLTRQLGAATRIPLDFHFMVEHPEAIIDSFPIRAGDWVSIHAESTYHLQRLLVSIRAKGAHPMVALNPATPLCMLEDVLDDIDGVLIMSVNPGFAGQKLVPHAVEKVAALRRMLDEAGRTEVEIEVDGNISVENAIRMKDAGANIFVLGTSSIFIGDMEQNIRNFRARVFG